MCGKRSQQAEAECRAREVNSSGRRVLVDDSLEGIQ